MPEHLDGMLWLLLLLGPLLFFQRQLHQEIQIVLLLITRRSEFVPVIFALIFLPGVTLHELSHFLAAKILQVRTGRFSLLPRTMPGGRLQLGYVETAPTDWLRDTLIGAAPLIFGGVFVAYAGLARLGVSRLWDAASTLELESIVGELGQVYHSPDFWVWFYLIFTVSSTMFPSKSDRRAWLPLTILVTIFVGAGVFIGIGPWLYTHLAPTFNQVCWALAAVFGISILAHLVLLLPTWLLRRGLMHLGGLKLERGG